MGILTISNFGVDNFSISCDKFKKETMTRIFSNAKLLLVTLLIFAGLHVPHTSAAKEKIALVIERPPVSGGSSGEHFIGIRPMATKPKKSYTYYFIIDGAPVTQTLTGTVVFNLKFREQVVVMGCGDNCKLKEVTNYMKKDFKVTKDKDDQGNRVWVITPK